MSVKIMGGVWDLDLPPAQKLVLLALADHADHDGRRIFPGIQRIARKTGYPVRTVRRLYRLLEASGILVPVSTEAWRGKAVEYRIVLERGTLCPPFKPYTETGKGDIGTVKEDTVSPQPSGTILKG